jgi:hypothetical protein
MYILAHRGYWRQPGEKNRQEAFRRAFDLGFGVETDIRDHNGELVISHDIANADADAMPFGDFLELYRRYRTDLPLALNIKADGLQRPLQEQLAATQVSNYFVFDMSIPDTLGYLRSGMPVFTRQSEHEPTPALYADARGIWLDEFQHHWIDRDTIAGHLEQGKALCIVSPELHQRPHEVAWRHYRQIEIELDCDRLMLCTDFPEQAREYFNG